MVQSKNEVEDLTRFADESFDTDEVDLFAFTGDDESLLTRLKSIILSLDWEISDDILDELFREVARLRSIWEGDKVAQVYLQGLEKVGHYLRIEGVHAHPNAIKLLLTLFYNYEKIFSSPDINGEAITSLLKSDIRKFKVLQFQIGKIGPAPTDSVNQAISTTQEKEIPETEHEFLADMGATIFGLEWEVTDEGLEQFNHQAEELHEHLLDNKPAEVLLQGLQALGAYISEEKVNAHPDAFTLLRSFYDGLKILVSDKDLDTEKRREILIDRVNRLNSLKEIIAAASTIEPVDRADDEVDKILDFAVDSNVVEDQPADEQYPDDILDPDAIQPVSDEITDDFIEDEGLEENLELLFSDDKADDGELDDLEVALADVDQKSNNSLDSDEDLFLAEDDEDKSSAVDKDIIIPALAEADDEEGFREDVKSAGLAEELNTELEDKLDSFFGFSENERDIDIEPAVPSIQQVGRKTTADTVASALADEDVEGGLREEEAAAELVEDSSDDLQDKLDSFFDSEDVPETGVAAAQESKANPEEPLEEEIDSFFTEDETSNADQGLIETEPALADADEISGFNVQETVTGLADSTMEDIDDKLDSFFDEEKEESVQKASTYSTVLSSLTAVTSTLSHPPAPDDLKQIAELVAAGKEEIIGANQTLLLTMIDSAVALLSKNPEAAAENYSIMRELVAGLGDAENPGTLTETVQRYTSWQQNFFDTIISKQKTTLTTTPSAAVEGVDDEVTLQMQAGFSKLRETMMKEFDDIRKELKQK